MTPGEDVDGPITVVVNDPVLDAPIETEVPVADHEAGQDDNGSEYAGPTVGGEANEVEPTEQEQDSGLAVVDGSEDTTVSARDEDGQDIPARIDEDGNIRVTPGEDVDGPITVVVEDPALDAPIETEVPVTGHESGQDDNGSEYAGPDVEGTPETVLPEDFEQDTGLDVVDESEDTTITATDEDNQDIPVRVDEGGDIQVTPGEDVDGPITVVVEDPALDAPIETEVPVNGHLPGVDDNQQDAELDSDLEVGSSGSWFTGLLGTLFGIGGIFAVVMETMHQNNLLDRAADQWWRNITNR